MVDLENAPAWVSGKRAAELFGMSWPTLRRLLVEHDLPHIRNKHGRYMISPRLLNEAMGAIATDDRTRL